MLQWGGFGPGCPSEEGSDLPLEALRAGATQCDESDEERCHRDCDTQDHWCHLTHPLLNSERSGRCPISASRRSRAAIVSIIDQWIRIRPLNPSSYPWKYSSFSSGQRQQ